MFLVSAHVGWGSKVSFVELIPIIMLMMLALFSLGSSTGHHPVAVHLQDSQSLGYSPSPSGSSSSGQSIVGIQSITQWQSICRTVNSWDTVHHPVAVHLQDSQQLGYSLSTSGSPSAGQSIVGIQSRTQLASSVCLMSSFWFYQQGVVSLLLLVELVGRGGVSDPFDLISISSKRAYWLSYCPVIEIPSVIHLLQLNISALVGASQKELMCGHQMEHFRYKKGKCGLKFEFLLCTKKSSSLRILLQSAGILYKIGKNAEKRNKIEP